MDANVSLVGQSSGWCRAIRVATMICVWLAGWTPAFAQTPYTWSLAGNGNWGTSANWTPSSGYPVAGDTAIFDAATGRTITIDAAHACDTVNVSGTGAWTWSGANTLSVAVLFNHAGSGDCTLSAILDGTGALTTSGHLHVTGANTYSGVTTLSSGGYLYVGNDLAFQNSSVVSLGSGTFAAFGGSRIVGVPVSFDGDTIFGSGHDTTTRTLTFTNTATLTGNRVIKVYGSNSGPVGSWSRDAIFNLGITDGANSYSLTTSSDNPSTATGNGHGYLKLNGGSSFGQLIVNGCAVQLNASNTFDNETRLEAGADPVRPGVLLIGTNAALGAQDLRILGGFIHALTVDRTVTNNLYLDGNLASSSLGTADKYLTFAGTTTLSGSRTVNTADRRHLGISGAIVDGGSGYSLTKQGTGYLRLSGASSFSGGVRVEEGQLYVNDANALGSGTLTITNAVGVRHDAGSSVSITVTNDFQLDGDIANLDASASYNSTLKTTGTTTLSGDRNITIYADGNGSRSAIEFAGMVTDGAGTWGLTKFGAGTLTLSGSNVFDGGITMYAGRLNLPNANPLLNGGIRVVPGRSIAYMWYSSASVFINDDQSLGAGSLAWEGTPVYRPAPYPYGIGAYLEQNVGASPGYVAVANDVTLSGYIGNSGSSTGGRTLTLTDSTPTLGGDTILNVYMDGNGDRALAFDGGLTDGSSGYCVIKVGNGSLSLRGANAFDGGIQIYGGTVYVTNDNTAMTGGIRVTGGSSGYQPVLRGQARTGGSLFGPGAITLEDSNAQLWLDSLSTVADTALPELVFSKANPTIRIQGVASGTTWTAARLTRGGRAVLTFRGSGSSPYPLTSNDKFKLTTEPAVSNGMIAPHFIETSGDFLTYNASGRGIERVAAYTSGDVNSAAAGDIYSPSSAQTLSTNREVYAVKTGYNLDGVGQDLAIGSGGLSINANNPVIACNVQFGSAEGVIWNSVSSTISGSIKGANGLTKAGGGTLVLGAANPYTGVTTILNGQVSLNAAGAFPDGQPLTINAGNLELNGQSLTVADLTMAGGQILNSSASASTLTLGTNVIYNGSYSQANVWPAATRTLDATLTGATTFDIADGYSGADMRIGDSASSRFVVLSGTGTPIIKQGPGFLQFSGNNTFTGDITVKEGMLHGTVHSSSFQPFGDTNNNVTLARNGILSFGGGGTGYGTAFGDLVVSGANGVRVNVGTANIAVNLKSLTRQAGTRATLLMLGAYTSGSYFDYWGVGRAFNVLAWKTPNPSPNTNRILPAWIVHTRRASDLTVGNFAYADNASGEVKALDGVGVNAYQHHKNTLVGAAATEVIDLAAAEGLAADVEVYALRTAYDIMVSGGDPTLTLGSGGMIANADLAVAPKVSFDPVGAGEALVYVGGYLGYVKTATLAGSLTAAGGLTKFGEGVLSLTADSSATLSGDHWINQGTLRLGHASALAPASAINIERGAVLDIGGNYTLNNAIKGLGGITTTSNVLTIGATGSLTPGFADETGSLTVEDLDFRGMLNWEYDDTTNDVVSCTTLAFGGGGTATISARWIGSGDVAEGRGPHTLFTYEGADPVLPTCTVVMYPLTEQGEVTLDAANKRVLLTISKRPNPSVFVFR